jgi:hypothetical protein
MSWILPVSRRRRRGAATLPLVLVVVLWWLTLGAIVVTLVPRPAASAPTDAYRPSPGAQAHAEGIGRGPLPIPVDRAAFDLAQRGFAESDDAQIDEAFEGYEWIAIAEHIAVRILQVDGAAAQIEMLDGPYAGRTGWLQTRHLGP